MITNPVFSSFFDDFHTFNKTKNIGTVYNGYRIFIGIFFSINFLISLQLTHQNYWVLINFLPTFIYLIIGILLFLGYQAYPKQNLQLVGLSLDLVAFSLIFYFSGADSLQFIVLFLVTVSASFMLLDTKQAILITVFAIVLVMYQQFNLEAHSNITYSTLNNFGLMTVSFIVVAFLSHTFSKRLKQIEGLSQRQINEVNALNAINEKIVQIIEQGVLVVSHQLDIILANDTAIGQLNLKPDEAEYFLPMLKPELAKKLRPVIQKSSESLIIHQDSLQPTYPIHNDSNANHYSDLRLRITQLGSQHTLILIEDLRREQSHAQQLKLASLGQLTASIAHEIRNPLAAISQASQLLIEDANDPDSDLSEDNVVLYDMIFKQTKRVNQIIEDVLKLSRQQKPSRIYIEPKTWLVDFINEHFASQDVALHCHTENGFMFDKYQLEQVLINLVNNGLRFSGKSHSHAYVTIEVNQVGRYIHIDVLDTGTGVKQSDLQYLFNPFFTTDHQGTGLGLYLSQAFCQANHADLQYIPNHEQTCFRIICNKKFLRNN